MDKAGTLPLKDIGTGFSAYPCEVYPVGQAGRLPPMFNVLTYLPSLISIEITICQPLKSLLLQPQLAEQQQRRTPNQIALRVQMQAIRTE